MSVRVEAGTPYFAQAARKVARVTSPVVTGPIVLATFRAAAAAYGAPASTLTDIQAV